MATSIKFRTAYTERKRANCPSGSRFKNEYAYERDEFGKKKLIKTGETDLYAKIQEGAEDTKLDNIIAKITQGDTSMVRPDGIYGDLTQAPSSLLEAMQQIQKLENIWGSLDNDIKRKYNFDMEEFIGASDTEEWARDMGLLAPEPKPEPAPVEKEGKADE